MKQLTVIFTILTALLLATSCSKEELPGDENTDEPGQMQTYTFTVSPDLTMEGDAETRSEGTPEEMPTRCFMQILGNNISQDVQQGKSIENGSFTFSVKLPNTRHILSCFGQTTAVGTLRQTSGKFNTHREQWLSPKK